MTPSAVSEILAATIPAGMPVLLVGPPGVGKSDLVTQAALKSGADLIVSHPAVADPTDAKGLPWPSAKKDHATFLPFGDLARAIAATKPTVWMLDDLGQATGAVQAGYMQLLLSRRVNDHILPDCVTFIAATNRRTDRAGVTGLLEPVKSRFVTILHMDSDVDDWCVWALDAGLPTTLVSFVRFRPDFLSAFAPSADLTQSPTPRTWSFLAKIEGLKLRPNLEAEAMAGAVGAGAATEYLAYRRMVDDMPNLDNMLMDPSRCVIPTSPGELYAVATGLAARASMDNFARIAQIGDRLHNSANGEFAALMLRDAIRRTPKISGTRAWITMAAGPLGRLISAVGNA